MFITREQWESIVGGNLDLMNTILDDLCKKATEDALITLPQVVGNIMNQTSTLRDLAARFYLENPELKEHKQLVGKLISDEEQRNPGKIFEDILKTITPVAKDVVRRLGTVSDQSTKPTRDNLKSIDLGIL